MDRPTVVLRRLQQSDLATRVRWLNDPAVNRYLSYDLPVTMEGTQAWFDRVNNHANRHELVVLADGRDPIGFAGFLNIDTRVGRAEHHIFIGSESHRGRGYGSAAYRALADYGFTVLGLNRIYGYQHVDNVAAHRTTARAGWTQEGLLRQDGLYHGIPTDRYVISLLRHEWASQHQKDDYG